MDKLQTDRQIDRKTDGMVNGVPTLRNERGRIGVFLLKRIQRVLVIICWMLFVMLLFLNLVPSTLPSYRHYTNNDDTSPRIKTQYLYEEKYFHVSANQTWNSNGPLLSILNYSVHLYSAIAHNSTENSFYDVIYLSGWENRLWANAQTSNYTCCLLFSNGDTTSVVGTRLRSKHDWSYVGRAKLEVKQFLCGNILHERGLQPAAVSLGLNRQCPKDHSQYIKVDYPREQPDEAIGVCAKLIYGTINASILVEWFEYQRYMGVSKVFSYTENLNPAAMSVLDYYKKDGIGEHSPYELPMTDGNKRNVGVKNFQAWNDEQITVYDCQGKMSGYKHVALYDVDEYLVPTIDADFHSLVITLKERHPKAAGFTFKTEVYASTWGADNSSDAIDDMTIGRYTLRTDPFRDRVKSMILTERVLPGRLSTHGYWAVIPYKKAFVEVDVAVLKHYRTCRKEWLKKDGDQCYKILNKVKDTTMFQYAAKLRDRVNIVKNKLGIK